MNYESREEKENLCRIYLEDLETMPASELALWRLPRLAGSSSRRKRLLGIWSLRPLLPLVLDYCLDGAWLSSATTSIQSTACASILGTHGLCPAVLRPAPSASMHKNFVEVNAIQQTDLP